MPSDLPPFVSANWLADHLDEVVVADVRWSLDGREGHATYLDGHLPGAIYVDLDADLAAPPTTVGGRHPLPTPAAFASALGDRGIGDDDIVVAYDTLGGAVAGRLAWLLRVVGQGAAVLSGGLTAWEGPLEPGEVVRRPTTRTIRPWPVGRLAATDDVAALAADDHAVVVDVRAPERFRGEHEPIDARAGHVPGAVNVPVARHLAGGHVRREADLRAVYGDVGVLEAGEVVVSCGSGVNACFGLLALETIGVTGRLFPGSWSAWAADPARPVATGAAGDERG